MYAANYFAASYWAPSYFPRGDESGVGGDYFLPSYFGRHFSPSYFSHAAFSPPGQGEPPVVVETTRGHRARKRRPVEYEGEATEILEMAGPGPLPKMTATDTLAAIESLANRVAVLEADNEQLRKRLTEAEVLVLLTTTH